MKSLVEILVGVVDQADLDKAVAISTQQSRSLFDVVLDETFIAEDRLLQVLADALGLPFELIDRATVDTTVATEVPEAFARDRHLLPLFQLGDELTVAMSNPFDVTSMDDVMRLTGSTVNVVLTLRDNITDLYNYCYSSDRMGSDVGDMENLVEMGLQLIGESGGGDEAVQDLAQEAPIAKIVDSLIRQAVEMGASDIHIEPEESVVKVRYRVDGLLRDVAMPPKKLEAPIMSRIKILANMDITEKRKPQDGRISMMYQDREVDFRVSTVRTIYGEKMVLRVLDKAGNFFSIERLGLTGANYETFRELIRANSGVIIVCGPTGSGKTSSLYAALGEINSPEKNIITLEDPVEYSLPGVNQIPVNPKLGVDFAKGLATIVRQDPDIIMVGEGRDVETASTAIQAALTGHLVFTTLHTRNAPGALTRLLDMGIAPYLLTSAIIGVIAQRLVRALCGHCKREVTDFGDEFLYPQLVAAFKAKTGNALTVFEPVGCKYCNDQGYQGRTGIFEIMVMSESISEKTHQRAATGELLDEAVNEGMITLLDDGLQKVHEGVTSLDELARVLDL